MSGQRARSAVPAEHRSAVPGLPGLPWWAAVLLAVTATAIGFAYDAGSGGKTLSAAFTVCYVTGCVLAVLVVRQSGLFSAVIQPALILFVAVPTAFFLFHGSEIKGIKDILINCGYPLIERFPLMFFTAATVLIIGAARWYLNSAAKRHQPDQVNEPADKPAARKASQRAARVATADTAAEAPAPRSRRRPVERPAAVPDDDDAPRPRRSRTPSAASRSRRDRPPETEIIDAVQARPRRSRPPVDPNSDEPRRRPRSEDSRERRNLPPVERRGAPDRSERPQRRNGAPVGRSRADRYERPERQPRSTRVPEYEDYDDYRPPAGAVPSNGTPTHHPVSRVRYRSGDADEPRLPPLRPRSKDAEAWEYDL